MDLYLRWLHPTVWIAWFIYWRVAASGAKVTARSDSSKFRWLYTFPLVIAVFLFQEPGRIPSWRVTLFPDHAACFVIGTILLALGMAITIWARVELGRNWSAVVTVKVGHELVKSGPYRWARHPIYTGLLLALTGSALAQDYWSDLAIPAVVFIAFWIKLRREEQWMREEFGAAYDDYCARTKRLIPFLL